jgi:hypothetical protein
MSSLTEEAYSALHTHARGSQVVHWKRAHMKIAFAEKEVECWPYRMDKGWTIIAWRARMSNSPTTSPICLAPINTENTAVLTFTVVVLVSSPIIVAPAPAPIPANTQEIIQEASRATNLHTHNESTS